MVVDVKRAFLHGLCTRSMYIELPGAEPKGGKCVGKLIRALYGTRDAPLAWQTVVKSDMKEMGFDECKVTSGVFTHRKRDLRTVPTSTTSFSQERGTISFGSGTKC